MKRLAASFVVPMALGALLAGAAPSTGPASASPRPATAASAQRTPTMAAVAARPASERILSLSASATQMLYGIGAGKLVVGVDKYSTYPLNAPRTNFTGYETSAEDYLYLKPSLVIFAFPTKLVQQLQQVGVRSLVLPPATNLAGVDAQIKELGKATTHVKGAKRLESSLAAKVAAAVAAAHGAGRGASYYVELDPKYYYTATPNTFIGSEFSLFGMRDIAAPAAHGASYPEISAEYVLKANPDYVFLADAVCCHQTAASFAARPGFNGIRAVKLHHVITVNDSVASEWGPHTIEEFLDLLVKVLR